MTKILLIDDEADFCFMIKLNLESIGDYKVITAANGQEGIKNALWYRPDIALLDIAMPDMDGLDVLKNLKKSSKTQNIPIIMLTARNTDEFKIKAAGLRADDYIIKPIKSDLLKSKIEKVLQRKSSANNSNQAAK